MLIYGFVKDHREDGKQSFVIEESKCNNKKFYQLIDDGFKLVLNNNYDSINDAYEIMEAGYIDDNNEEQRAYKYACVICKQFISVSRAIGQKWSNSREKWIVFNGYVDEQCANDNLRHYIWK